MKNISDTSFVSNPWLNRLNEEPDQAIDSLLRGVAHLPGLQRATPSEALIALLSEFDIESAEWKIVDEALLRWLKNRRSALNGLLERPGGVERFIRETSEGFRIAWRLMLPKSCTWIHENLFDLLHWANTFSLTAAFDLGKAVLIAAAHLQEDSEFRFLWLRICEEAAITRLRHRLDTALLGLAKIPSHEIRNLSRNLLIGLSRWAVRMPSNDQAKSEVVREWRALKAAFPRQPSFWREQWEGILKDERISTHPFVGWLWEADPALQVKKNDRGPRRTPQLPRDISGTIERMKEAYRLQGLSLALWQEMRGLLDHLEHYAETTGENYYLVTSCTNIASIILDQAPGQALLLARRALLWAPSNGHAWSIRALALGQLGRSDLVEAVLWEAVRRLPSNPVLYTNLASIWISRGGFLEAEVLLRKVSALAPKDAIVLDSLASVLIAQNKIESATEVLEQYRNTHGNNNFAKSLERYISMGTAGQNIVQARLRDQYKTVITQQKVLWDLENAEFALTAEQSDFPHLQRISQVAQADLLFQLGSDRRKDALHLVDDALSDPGNTYAQVVKGLAVPEYRTYMLGKTGRFLGSLPVRLALTPDNVTADYWNDLLINFPEWQHLIYLVQLARGVDDEYTRLALKKWSATPTNWDNSWDSYLKTTINSYLNNKDIFISLETLVHDALTQAVDVGLQGTPLAA